MQKKFMLLPLVAFCCVPFYAKFDPSQPLDKNFFRYTFSIFDTSIHYWYISNWGLWTLCGILLPTWLTFLQSELNYPGRPPSRRGSLDQPHPTLVAIHLVHLAEFIMRVCSYQGESDYRSINSLEASGKRIERMPSIRDEHGRTMVMDKYPWFFSFFSSFSCSPWWRN